MTVFDLKSANATELQARMGELQAKMISLDTPADQVAEIQAEMMSLIAQIRTLKESRGKEIAEVVAKVKSQVFTIKEIFGENAIEQFSDLEITQAYKDRGLNGSASGDGAKASKERVSISADDVKNQVLVGTYEINGKQVEIKIGDYDRDGKIVRQLVPIGREFKSEIIGRGIDGFLKAIEGNNEGKALLLKHHTATVGKTVGQLVFPNIAPIVLYTGFDKDELEFKLGAMALRVENHKTTQKETDAVAYMEKKAATEPHNEVQAEIKAKAKK